jgi:hypothetical protein
VSLNPLGLAWKLSFQLCPIFLTGGIAGSMPGGALPIILLTEALNFTGGITEPSSIADLDTMFGNFQPLPGSKLIDQQAALYPFANQKVAANAVITEPLTVSLRMDCPVREGAGYFQKLATMTALQATLAQHNAAGGTYTVATPTYFYTNCLLRSLEDISDGATKQAQLSWRWDFIQPLLTQAQAIQAQNNLMSQISNGSQINGQPSYSGLNPTVGSSSSVASPSVVPGGAGSAGSLAGGSFSSGAGASGAAVGEGAGSGAGSASEA